MLQENIVSIIRDAKNALDQRGGLKAVYFVGCGGSWAASHTAFDFVSHENTSMLVVGHINSNEFVHAVPKSVGPNTLVIVTSMKATPESVEALRTAKEKGAYTIAVTGGPETLMAKTADRFVVYTHSEHYTCAFHSVGVNLRIGVELLAQYEGYPYYSQMLAAIDSTDERLAQLRKQYATKGIRFAVDHRDKKIFHVFSSGSMYGVGYSEAYCHFAEMQQLNAIPFNSAEFFHGPFEVTVPDQPSVLFINLGRTRDLDLRAKRFLKEFCDYLTILDAADFGLDDICAEIQEYVAPLLMGPTFRYAYVERLAEERQHPMTMRRYMWKFDY